MKHYIILVLFTICFIGIANAQNSLYEISVKNAQGKEITLKEYEGNVLLIVNTATECGFTPQYEALERLYKQYKEKGLVVLDFPCNQFGGQAPGTIAEIKGFCTAKYGTTFPLFAKIDVNGAKEATLYTYLKKKKGFEGFSGERAARMDALLKKQDKDYANKPDIKWNFTKFLIDKKGNVIARFEPTASMTEVENAIKTLL